MATFLHTFCLYSQTDWLNCLIQLDDNDNLKSNIVSVNETNDDLKNTIGINFESAIELKDADGFNINQTFEEVN